MSDSHVTFQRPFEQETFLAELTLEFGVAYVDSFLVNQLGAKQSVSFVAAFESALVLELVVDNMSLHVLTHAIPRLAAERALV